MKTTIDTSPERKIIQYMITSTQFLKEVVPLFRSHYLKVSYCRIVADWCVEYYSNYKVAPEKNIQDIYISKKKTLDTDEVDNVSSFLVSISEDWEESTPTNIDYAINEAIKYLNIRALTLLRDNITISLVEGDVDKGSNFVTDFAKVEKPTGEGVNVLKDTSGIINAFLTEQEELLTFPKALDTVIGPVNRGDFVSFFGPAGRSKSFFLWYTAEQAMKQGRKVVYITLEMTKNEIIRRAWPSLTGKPRKDKIVHYSKFIEEDGMWSVDVKEKHMDGVNLENVKQFQNKLRKKYRGGSIQIIPFAANSVSPNDLELHLDNLEYYSNYLADVIVIDYADLLMPNKSFHGREYRHSLDNIWKNLRGLALNKNIGIITASHTEKRTFDTDVKASHASEDIRKINHVTTAIGLNQTEQEAMQNIIRIGQLKIREERKSFEQAVVLQCLDLGRACIDSRLVSQVIGYDDAKYQRK